MKKVSKAILIALGILLAVGAAAVLGVNLYVQSAGTQARIQRGLSRALHTPVKIASVSFMPWYGLKLTGITGQDADGGDVLQISRISARVRLWKLILRKVVIKDLTVDEANIMWSETPEGKWQLPGRPPAVENEAPEASGTDAPAQPSPSPEIQPQAQPREPVAGETVPAQISMEQRPLSINRFRMRDSSFVFHDKNQKQIVAFSGVNVQSLYPTPESINGSTSISQIAIQNLFFMRDCQTDFSYSPTHLSLLNAHSTIAGGASTGSLNVKIAEPDSPFNFDANFSGIQLEQIMAEAGVQAAEVSGALAGFLHLQGNLRSSAAASGTGQFTITAGHVSKLELFDQLALLLHNEKLRQFNLQQALVNYHIGDGKILVDEVVIKASDIDLLLTGQGTMEMAGGALALKCRLTIGRTITEAIPDILMENFGRDEAANTRYLDFDVFGTLSSPKTNLLKLIGSNLEHGAKSIWKSIFGGKQKTPFAPVSTPEPAAAPAPATPPAATASPTP